MNQYRISILIDAEDEGQALINLAETIEENPDISGIFTVEHVYASEPPKHEQVEAWLGSDNTQEEAIKTLAQVASGEYKPEELRKDIRDYNK